MIDVLYSSQTRHAETWREFNVLCTGHVLGTARRFLKIWSLYVTLTKKPFVDRHEYSMNPFCDRRALVSGQSSHLTTIARKIYTRVRIICSVLYRRVPENSDWKNRGPYATQYLETSEHFEIVLYERNFSYRNINIHCRQSERRRH